MIYYRKYIDLQCRTVVTHETSIAPTVSTNEYPLPPTPYLPPSPTSTLIPLMSAILHLVSDIIASRGRQPNSGAMTPAGAVLRQYSAVFQLNYVSIMMQFK